MFSVFGKRYLVYYFGVWVIIMVSHFLVLRFSFGLESQTAVAESVVFNGVFAILGIGLAFTVRFADLVQRPIREQLFYHLTGATVTILVWMASSQAVLRSVSDPTGEYVEFLKSTTTMRIISGVLLYVALIVVHYLLLRMKELSQQKNKEQELKGLLREAELNALRSQIRPHFLFNSLNSISSLVVSDPAGAREMVIKLAEFMRYSLNLADQPMSTVEKELYHTRLYIDIEKVRFGERLNILLDGMQGTTDHGMPSMTLQPLVENAIKYGVYNAIEPVNITISIKKQAGVVFIEIVNPIHPDERTNRGTGTGIKNIEARLVNIYHRDDLLKTFIKDHHFYATLKLPEHE